MELICDPAIWLLDMHPEEMKTCLLKSCYKDIHSNIILWPPDTENQLIGKDPDTGKDWGQEEKGVTENEMVGWHHWLNGYEFEQTLGDGEGRGSLACFSLWGHRVRHDLVTEQQQKEKNSNVNQLRMDKQRDICCLVIKRNEVLMHVATWM